MVFPLYWVEYRTLKPSDFLLSALNLLRFISLLTVRIFCLPISVFLRTLSGSHPTAYVAIVETSISAAIRNRLAWIRTPAINVFLMISIGHFSSLAIKRFLMMAKSTINHSAKLAKFFIIFRNFQSGASR